MYGTAVAKSHFMFGRMHIDIHNSRFDIQEKNIRWLAVAMQDVGIGLSDGVSHRSIAYIATIDVKILAVGAAACVGGACDHPLEGNKALFLVHFQTLLNKVAAQNITYARQHICRTPLALYL